MKAPKEGSCDPIAPLELPHAMHAFHRVCSTDKLNMVSYMYFFPFSLLMPVHICADKSVVLEMPIKRLLMKLKMLVKQQSS